MWDEERDCALIKNDDQTARHSKTDSKTDSKTGRHNGRQQASGQHSSGLGRAAESTVAVFEPMPSQISRVRHAQHRAEAPTGHDREQVQFAPCLVCAPPPIIPGRGFQSLSQCRDFSETTSRHTTPQVGARTTNLIPITRASRASPISITSSFPFLSFPAGHNAVEPAYSTSLGATRAARVSTTCREPTVTCARAIHTMAAAAATRLGCRRLTDALRAHAAEACRARVSALADRTGPHRRGGTRAGLRASWPGSNSAALRRPDRPPGTTGLARLGNTRCHRERRALGPLAPAALKRRS